MFIDATIAQCAAYGFVGGPTLNTRIVSLRNERERRNANWAVARHSYSAPYQNISKLGMAEIRRMFLVCRGRLHCFRFRDPISFEAVNDQFGVGDGVTNRFQLSTRAEVDGVVYDRLVALPILPIITVDNVPDTPDVDFETGMVDFGSSPPANGEILRWSGTYDVKVRFDQDDLPFSFDNPNALNGSVKLMEVLDDA